MKHLILIIATVSALSACTQADLDNFSQGLDALSEGLNDVAAIQGAMRPSQPTITTCDAYPSTYRVYYACQTR
jgi:hypothetical protein